jgi:hypothetical protein
MSIFPEKMTKIFEGGNLANSADKSTGHFAGRRADPKNALTQI